MIAAHRLVELRSSGARLAVVAPTADGVRALFEQGAEAWTENVRGTVGSPTGESAEWLIVAAAQLERLAASFEDRRALEIACVGDARQPCFLPPAADSAGMRAEYCYVPAQLLWFAGHFPGHPIVPGAVLVDWAIARLKRWLGGQNDRVAVVTSLARLKFQRPVLPHAVLRLELHAADGRGRFQFVSRLGRHAGGDFRWNAP